MTAATACRTCGTEPREGARFCDGCGAPVTEQDTLSAVPRADIYVADDVHYPNRRPRPKCSVRTAYCNFEFASGIDPSELLRCPAHDPGAYISSPSSPTNPYFW